MCGVLVYARQAVWDWLMAVLIVYTAIITPYSITFGRYDELDLASADEPLVAPREGIGAGAVGLGHAGASAAARIARADFRDLISIADLLADVFFIAGTRLFSQTELIAIHL